MAAPEPQHASRAKAWAMAVFFQVATIGYFVGVAYAYRRAISPSFFAGAPWRLRLWASLGAYMSLALLVVSCTDLFPAARAGGRAAEVRVDRGLRRRRRRSQRDGDRRPGRRRRGPPRPHGLHGRRRRVHRRAPRVLGVACSQVRRRQRPLGEWQALYCTLAGPS
jgi:hypothetical protein